MFVFIGTYSGGGSQGIYVYDFDAASGQLTFTGQTAQTQNPSFLAVHPNGRYLYAVNEAGKIGDKPGGGVSSFAFDTQKGGLTFQNQQSSGGSGPCHVTIDATGHLLAVANYNSGSISTYPIQEDGTIAEASSFFQHEGSSVNPKRQEGPHAHSTTIDKGNNFALAANLGLDKVFVYRLDLTQKKFVPNETPFVAIHPGAGPRHIAFHPFNGYVYVMNEIDSTISILTYDAKAGTLFEIDKISTLPEDFKGTNTGADIHIEPQGRFLYCSNRGHDSIAIFSIDNTSGHLKSVGYEPTQGKSPRNFAIDPSGKFLLVANQSSNVVGFRLDPETGKLAATGQVLALPAPVCIKFHQTQV